jgi:hypothetical protein
VEYVRFGEDLYRLIEEAPDDAAGKILNAIPSVRQPFDGRTKADADLVISACWLVWMHIRLDPRGGELVEAWPSRRQSGARMGDLEGSVHLLLGELGMQSPILEGFVVRRCVTESEARRRGASEHWRSKGRFFLSGESAPTLSSGRHRMNPLIAVETFYRHYAQHEPVKALAREYADRIGRSHVNDDGDDLRRTATHESAEVALHKMFKKLRRLLLIP